ncbi:hypothetical protein THAR02_00659 [Trichoderma harzianum]|uniref:DUF7580 domain-containing protein n=1 Tax=Trichoderma harzianum TaxID=5544 RepID=A0A0G0ARW1_TRIHA|nr:hypothetical protein THAR02_00659 [Trichoderma harzianum]
MEPLSQVELAQRAAQDVAVVAGNLQTKWRGSWFKNYSRQEHIKNLVILATSLMCISFSQDRYEQREHRDQQDDEAVKLETFLCGLELYPTNNLAKFNKQNEPSARFPTLNALVTANPLETIRSASDISILRKVQKSVEEFASASAYITGPYFAFLKSFSGVKDQAKRHAESAQRDPESQLNPKKTKTKSDEDESYPRHVYDTLKQRKARAVGFADKMCYDAVQDETRRDDATSVASSSEFCKLLGKDIGSGSMDVRIKDETLLILNRAVEIEVDIADGRSISLADVLSNNSLVPKTKLILAYILAKSVWQFYDSDFMGVRWTTKSIQLFREREDEDDDDEPGVDWAPYYAFSLEQMTERDSMERLPPGQFLHRYPRVLALGAILYELGQKKRWEKQATSSGPASSTSHIEPPTLEKMINDTSSKIRKGVQKKKWPNISLKNTQTLEEYRVIVANCASENFFRPDPKEKPPNSPAHSLQKTAEELEEELTVAERRAILFKKVVAPLKKMVQTTGWVDELGNIQRYSIEGATARLKDKRPDSEKSGSETLLDTPQTSQEFRTLPREIQDSRTASKFVTNSGSSSLHALNMSN